MERRQRFGGGGREGGFGGGFGGGGREGGFGGSKRFFAPVKVGDEVNVKIESVGEKGDGVAKIKGFVIFVPNTKEGDEVKIKITRVLRKVGFGEVLGKADAPPETEEAPAEEEAATEEEAGEAEPEEKHEDTEDFGEEEKK